MTSVAVRRPLPAFRIAGGVLAIYAATAATIALRSYAGPAGAPVVWPLVTLGGIFATFVYWISAKQRERVRFLEIGVFFAAFALLYAALPLVTYAIRGFMFDETSEPRLFTRATPAEIGTIAWYYVAFLAAFCLAYGMARPRLRRSVPNIRWKPDVPLIVAIIVAYGGIQVVSFLVTYGYGVATNDYSEAYAVVQHLPLLVAQIYVHVISNESTLQILAIVALVCHYRRTRWLVIAMLASLVVGQLLHPGARTELIVAFVAAAQAYELFVRRIPRKAIVAAGICGFLAFTVLGVLRSDGSLAKTSAVKALLTANDTDALYGNAFDLLYLKNGRRFALQMPSLFFSEITSVIPQQFLPFAKVSHANWYVFTYYPYIAEAGGGLAFGAVAQAIVGFGMLEIIVRGALLGWAFAWLHKKLMAPSVRFSFVVLYVWVSVWSFSCIRNTTLSILTSLAFHFFPPLAAVYLLALLIRRRRANVPAA